MKILMMILALLLAGCASVDAAKGRAGDTLVTGMQKARDEFCGGTFPLAVYEDFLESVEKTPAEYCAWCDRITGFCAR